MALVRALYADKTATVAEICQALHISRATLYRYLKTDQPKTDQGRQEQE